MRVLRPTDIKSRHLKGGLPGGLSKDCRIITACRINEGNGLQDAIRTLVGDVVVLDVETDGVNPYHGDRIFCWSYITNKGEYGFMLKTPQNLEFIKKIFNDPTKKVIFHHAKFDIKMYSFEGIDIFDIKAEVHCTLILSKMYNGMMHSYRLEWLGAKLLNRDTKDKTAIVDWLKTHTREIYSLHGRKPNFTDAPIDLVKRRANWDVETTLMLFHFLYPKVQRTCPKLYETERQLMFVVIDMENEGLQVDITRAKELRAECERGISKIQKDLDELVCPFVIFKKKTKRVDGEKVKIEVPVTIESLNTGSSALQLPAVFIKMGIELKYKTKPKKGKKGGKPSGGGRWSFDEYSMVRYVSPYLASVIRDSSEEGWPLDRWYDTVYRVIKEKKLDRSQLLPPLILKLTELKKLISTYYNHIINDAVDVQITPAGREIGVLHCNFNQSEAMTGRFSSSNPNIQNMPRILGPRECFIPRKGRKNYHIDYEQVEMKFFVHFAKDSDMAKAIESDIHLYVAAEIYNRAAKDVTKEQRKRAKGVNFGIIYGSGGNTMAETMTKKGLITSKTEATLLVAKYHKRFPSVRRITNFFKNELSRKGYVENPMGRRYHISLSKSYTALNYMCQGTSADLIKESMVKVFKWLRVNGYKSKIIKQIHDELVIQTVPSEAESVIPAIMKMMEDRKRFFIPITVDCEVVNHRWSNKEKVEFKGCKN